MKPIFESRLVNRNIRSSTGRTSMRLEPEIWDAVQEICQREGIDRRELLARAQDASGPGSSTGALRVFILKYFQAAATEEGHSAAGHGKSHPGGARTPPLSASSPG